MSINGIWNPFSYIGVVMQAVKQNASPSIPNGQETSFGAKGKAVDKVQRGAASWPI